MTGRDTLLTRLLRGALSSIVILLVADLIWQVVKTLIDRRLGEAQNHPRREPRRPSGRRGCERCFRSSATSLFVVLAVVAVLMALSALGVEIGPLIAGAGIVGVAIGFGSQTLVKDVISGIFYLLDDAFRVGEYIQSGSYKGTVESFGFRSVKLRHHRGPLFTVPFGVLGAVQNMSRDWVIDKMTVGVPTTLTSRRRRRSSSRSARSWRRIPSSRPTSSSRSRCRASRNSATMAIQIRLKMMTKPGEQFAIRRKAYALIKKAFDENGIRFAFPTVQVAAREAVEPLAAHHAFKRSLKPVAPE